MTERVWVLGAGGPAGFNVACAAKAAGYRVVGVDSSEAHLAWAETVCNETSVCDALPYRASREGELVLPQPEPLVWLAAYARDQGELLYHGPSLEAIEATSDKARAALIWSGAGLRPAPTVRIDTGDLANQLDACVSILGLPFWLRSPSGAGARGAMLAESADGAYHWIRLHQATGKGSDFIAEEYLPGRDYCWTGLYHRGELVGSFLRERLEWIYPHLAPFSGRTGTPTRCRVAHDASASFTAKLAVDAVDPAPNGVYCVDMRERADGLRVPTEINAGRWATTSPLYRHMGLNMVAEQIRLALGGRVEPFGDEPYPEGAELHRHVDMGLRVTWPKKPA